MNEEIRILERLMDPVILERLLRRLESEDLVPEKPENDVTNG